VISDHKKFGGRGEAAIEKSPFCHIFASSYPHILTTMKKNRKVLESPSIPIYEHIVKRILLNNLIALFLLGIFSPLRAEALRPTFIVLKQTDNFLDSVRILEASGAKISQRVPPSILIAA
jgi:hypothetical protein